MFSTRATCRSSCSVGRAFTLIELIVVIIVIGILATLAAVSYSAVIDRSETSKALTAQQSVAREVTAILAFQDDTTPSEALAEALNDLPAASVGVRAVTLDNGWVIVQEDGVVLPGLKRAVWVLDATDLRWKVGASASTVVECVVALDSTGSQCETAAGDVDLTPVDIDPGDGPPVPSVPDMDQVSKLLASDGAASDNFGFSVALSGDGSTLAVGSPYDDDRGSNSGSTYVFVRTGTTWTQQTKITAADGAASDYFGFSVALSGDGSTLAVGSHYDDDRGSNSGSTYVFVRTGTTWTQQTKITAADGAAGDQFGYSVALSGDSSTLAVGSYRDDDRGTDSGSTYIFVRTGTTWTQQTKIVAADGAASDNFGRSVSLSGDGSTLAVGSLYDDDRGKDSGSTYVFVRTGPTWSQQTKIVAGDGAVSDLFGGSVSLSGDGSTLAVGAYQDDDRGADSGSTYVFVRTGTTWTQQTKITAADGAASVYFGVSVSLSGDGSTLAVGAYLDDDRGSNSGSTYVFVRTGTTWSQQTKITAADGAASDLFGVSVSLSGDGSTLAVGAYQDDDRGTDSGSVYVYG